MPFHINPATGNPNSCSAKPGNCPFGSADEHYGSKDEARLAYETRMNEAALAVPHDKEETMRTGSGNSYSKVTEQPDGSLAQTINGHVVVIGKKNQYGHRVSLGGKHIGHVTFDKTKKKWDVTYPDSTSARSQRFPVDALSALVKKAAPKTREKIETKPKGYDPGDQSELNVYDDFPDNKAMTLSRLRQVSSQDLAHLYNRVSLSHYYARDGGLMRSDEAAMKRVRTVLAERGREIEVAQYGSLKPGQDFSDPDSYRLKD